ncbi:hypothetical protein Patl1_06569 [Pistacia atlantica]|uniref:Uncharacterized protein n=1 Tax=Pistacia atlantica TaxID=434234 RepID=A0ACC1BWD1_9ROSI|nr:hypothetical protein Patl1_06569 [Pistacia atlantica]
MGAIVSPEGDVYSYGILLLEMITGKRPTDEMFNEELPGERMNIEDVISELQATKTRMLQAVTQGRNIN